MGNYFLDSNISIISVFHHELYHIKCRRIMFRDNAGAAGDPRVRCRLRQYTLRRRRGGVEGGWFGTGVLFCSSLAKKQTFQHGTYIRW